MSRSPDSSQTTRAALDAYQNSWEAIYNLIDEGKSWSGGERNCAFLNTGGARFANISAACGVDFQDDGRAVAIADWDFDGQLDFWVTNRTAPRIRLLHNAAKRAPNFTAFRLQGQTCNRDAIGARLELWLRDGSKSIKTLHAGDGFLAQSSKWVHFGLGNAEIVKLVVRWPGGEAESFSGVEPGKFYRIVQGAGGLEGWLPPAGRVALEESPLEIPDQPAGARTWVVGRVPFPAEQYSVWGGGSKALADFRGRPLLVNLWSETCAPCVAELRAWQQHADTIRSAGARILALCVDPSAQPGPTANTSFDSGIATPEIISAFETVNRALLESRRPLPVPCSVLLDADGLVAAIYKGTLSHESLIADIALLDSAPDRQRAAALPFPGRWSTPPLGPLPRQVIGTMMKAGNRDAARAYAARCLTPESKLVLAPAVRASITLFLGDLYLDDAELDQAVAIYSRLFELAPDDAALHREVGRRLVTKQRVADAIRHLDTAVEHEPRHLDSRLNLASLQMRVGMVAQATAHFRELAKQLPDSAPVHLYLANALQAQGLTKDAIGHYRAAHRLQPNSQATNNLAWILATNSDDEIRDGAGAVALALQACEASAYKIPLLLNTLGAAYAEAGQFDQAIAAAEKGISLAKSASVRDPALIGQISANLESYRAGHPIRD